MDVDVIRELTRQLDAVAKAYGGYTEILTPVASRAEKWGTPSATVQAA